MFYQQLKANSDPVLSPTDR